MQRILSLLLVMTLARAGQAAYLPPDFPFAPAAGEPGSAAVGHDDARIRGWASSVVAVEYGAEVAEEWKRPEAALGPAGATDPDVLVLGRGGRATLSFEHPIRNGEGDDFVVFENGIRDTFLELAWVEVSTDGLHFVRFPNYSYTHAPVPAFGDVYPTYIHGLAGKYRAGFGTPFDLQELADAHAAVMDGFTGFSQSFRQQLLDNFPHLDLQDIAQVRLIDIVGDGGSRDCQDQPIYDPYPTIITAGFDLDAVGVLNRREVELISFAGWSARNGLAADPAADTDGDRWCQYLEYLAASDPRDPRSRPIVRQFLSKDGLLILEYTRNLSAEAAPAAIHIGGDGSWTRHAGPVEVIGTAVEDGLERSLERLTLPVTDQPLWVRFGASTP